MDWPVYLINLDKDRRRLEAATAQLARAEVPWTRVAAVNGRALSADEIAAVYDAKMNRRCARHPLTAPEIGCYLSHLKAWSLIRSAAVPGAIILEDDFRIDGNLRSAIHALSSDPGAWDIAKLFTFRPNVKLLRARDLAPGMRIGVPYRVPSTTLGYAIRRDAVDRLLRLSQPFFRPIDEDHKFFWEKHLKIAQVDPVPIVMGMQDTVEGTVGESRRAAARHDDRSVLGRAIQGFRYQIGYTVRLHIQRLQAR
ncbi:MAG: glycosyltransferase family 25 protein [Pseudomonadota bacterium]